LISHHLRHVQSHRPRYGDVRYPRDGKTRWEVRELEGGVVDANTEATNLQRQYDKNSKSLVIPFQAGHIATIRN
jgi:hypothetical protein